MTFKQLKNRFSNLNYDLEFKVGAEGRGYYLRKFGTTGHSIFKNCRSAIETKLDFLEANNF